MSRLLAALSTALLFLVVVGFIAYVRFVAPPGHFLNQGIDTPSVVRQVQQMHDLVTVRYVVEKVVTLPHDSAALGLLLLVQARVLAGVPLSGITQYDVAVAGPHAVRLQLPQPKILDASISDKPIKVWDRRLATWGPWVAPNPGLEHQARLAALEQVRAAAIEQRILDDAANNARLTIANLLHAAGIRDVAFL